ncbi:hypothetical protein SASPL_141739 [Salvia splendens]|uniref:Golgi SNAP receptor complex member 1 n=1 Tax=Salvia splendens TaxID=180675 RepID=A0A8X8WJ29_SALSN|nr:hypothetical protein SASPL_141739 [Salvia splendens]
MIDPLPEVEIISSTEISECACDTTQERLAMAKLFNESGIDHLLKQLQQSSGGSEIFSHTLTRHQEILQDLTQVCNYLVISLFRNANCVYGLALNCEEFKRLHSSHRAKKEHASVLEDFREFDRSRLDLEEGGLVISQAQETLKSLVFQRSTFGGINSKLSNVGSRLPTVNNILSSIKKKKSMDTIILSLVASVCTFLILIYWWTK